MAQAYRKKFEGETIPCELCEHAELCSNGLGVYCRIQDEIICDRSWIDPRVCWKCCECLTCRHFKLRKEYGERE